jgi:hypothetical protein
VRGGVVSVGGQDRAGRQREGQRGEKWFHGGSLGVVLGEDGTGVQAEVQANVYLKTHVTLSR